MNTHAPLDLDAGLKTANAALIPEFDLAKLKNKSFGAILKTVREARQLSIADVSEKTRLDPKQIEALEEERFSELPESVFVRGFARQYAKILHIDESVLLNLLPPATQPSVQNTAQHLGFVPQDRTLTRISRKFRTILYILGILIATALIIWIVKERNTLIHSMKTVKTNSITQMSEPSISVASAPVKSPIEQTNAHPIQMQAALSSTTLLAPTPSQITDTPLIEVSFEEPAWVEIKDAQGKMLLSQNNLPGSQQSVKGMPPYSVSISQSQGVKLRYKGQVVTLPANNSNGSLNFKLE